MRVFSGSPLTDSYLNTLSGDFLTAEVLSVFPAVNAKDKNTVAAKRIFLQFIGGIIGCRPAKVLKLCGSSENYMSISRSNCCFSLLIAGFFSAIRLNLSVA